MKEREGNGREGNMKRGRRGTNGKWRMGRGDGEKKKGRGRK